MFLWWPIQDTRTSARKKATEERERERVCLDTDGRRISLTENLSLGLHLGIDLGLDCGKVVKVDGQLMCAVGRGK